MSALHDLDAYQVTSAALTRLTLDLRAALAHADDADSRAYAFDLAHLVRDLTDALTAGVWAGYDKAGSNALALLAHRARARPSTVPDWVRVMAAGWPAAAC